MNATACRSFLAGVAECYSVSTLNKLLLLENIDRSPAGGCYQHSRSHGRRVQKCNAWRKTLHLTCVNDAIIVGISDGREVSAVSAGEENGAIQLIDHLVSSKAKHLSQSYPFDHSHSANIIKSRKMKMEIMMLMMVMKVMMVLATATMVTLYFICFAVATTLPHQRCQIPIGIPFLAKQGTYQMHNEIYRKPFK